MTETHEYWERVMMAEHEAAHAIAAQEMGLPVAWVSIDSGSDEGIDFTGATKIPDELIDRERDCFAICVATSAPSHILTHRSHEIGRYARAEAGLAYEMGGMHEIKQAEIYDRAAAIVNERWSEIIELAYRLLEEGTVTLDAALVT